LHIAIDPLIAAGVLACTAVTDAAYVLFTAAVAATSAMGGKLERNLVSPLRLRRDQLYAEPRLRRVCRFGFLVWRLRNRQLAEARRALGDA
jgi:hypothetical protein